MGFETVSASSPPGKQAVTNGCDVLSAAHKFLSSLTKVIIALEAIVPCHTVHTQSSTCLTARNVTFLQLFHPYTSWIQTTKSNFKRRTMACNAKDFTFHSIHPSIHFCVSHDPSWRLPPPPVHLQNNNHVFWAKNSFQLLKSQR